MKNRALGMLFLLVAGSSCFLARGGEEETCPDKVNYPPGGVGKFFSEEAVLEACRVDMASTKNIADDCPAAEAKDVHLVCEGTNEIGIPLPRPIITTCREVLESTRGGRNSSLYELFLVDTGECSIRNFVLPQKQNKSSEQPE